MTTIADKIQGYLANIKNTSLDPIDRADNLVDLIDELAPRDESELTGEYVTTGGTHEATAFDYEGGGTTHKYVERSTEAVTRPLQTNIAGNKERKALITQLTKDDALLDVVAQLSLSGALVSVNLWAFEQRFPGCKTTISSKIRAQLNDQHLTLDLRVSLLQGLIGSEETSITKAFRSAHGELNIQKENQQKLNQENERNAQLEAAKAEEAVGAQAFGPNLAIIKVANPQRSFSTEQLTALNAVAGYLVRRSQADETYDTGITITVNEHHDHYYDEDGHRVSSFDADHTENMFDPTPRAKFLKEKNREVRTLTEREILSDAHLLYQLVKLRECSPRDMPKNLVPFVAEPHVAAALDKFLDAHPSDFYALNQLPGRFARNDTHSISFLKDVAVYLASSKASDLDSKAQLFFAALKAKPVGYFTQCLIESLKKRPSHEHADNAAYVILSQKPSTGYFAKADTLVPDKTALTKYANDPVIKEMKKVDAIPAPSMSASGTVTAASNMHQLASIVDVRREDIAKIEVKSS